MKTHEIELTQEQRDLLHARLYQILAEVDRVARLLGLRYYLIGGSLLGAVRNQGIIPWDDDIDVGMRRSDYEKFVTRASELLNPIYHLESARHDPAYHLMHSKICLDGTVFLQSVSDLRRTHHGIAVDVFALDYLPNNRLLRTVFYRLSRLLYTCVGLRCLPGASHRHGVRRLFALWGELALSIVPARMLKTACERLCGLWGNHPKRYIVPSFGMYREREIVPDAWFVGDEVARFGPLLAPIPNGWQPYLNQVYGDYMQPPPESARHGHPVLRLHT